MKSDNKIDESLFNTEDFVQLYKTKPSEIKLLFAVTSETYICKSFEQISNIDIEVYRDDDSKEKNRMSIAKIESYRTLSSNPNHINNYNRVSTPSIDRLIPSDLAVLSAKYPTRIHRLYVEPHYRNIGIGSNLMFQIIQKIESTLSIKNKLILTYMSPQKGYEQKLISFYEKYGFTANLEHKKLMVRMK